MLNEFKTKVEYYLCTPVSADSLFGDLPQQALDALASLKRQRQFEKDAYIFAADQPPQGINTLVRGQAEMRFNNLRPPRFIEQNEILGLTEMMAELPCKMSVVTVTPCVFDYIEREDFINFLKDQPEVGFRLARLMSLNLQKIYQLLCSATI